MIIVLSRTVSVQLSPHFLRIKGLEIVQINATGEMLISCMLRDELSVLFRRNGELCDGISIKK